MKLSVKYDNPYRGEHEEYTTTFEELVDSFNGILNEKMVKMRLRDSGEAILETGGATTIVKVVVRTGGAR
jgi:hypothetical protein